MNVTNRTEAATLEACRGAMPLLTSVPEEPVRNPTCVSVEEAILQCYTVPVIKQLPDGQIIKVFRNPSDPSQFFVTFKADKKTIGRAKTAKVCTLYQRDETGSVTKIRQCWFEKPKNNGPLSESDWNKEIGILRLLSAKIPNAVARLIADFEYRNNKGKLKRVAVSEYVPCILKTYLGNTPTDDKQKRLEVARQLIAIVQDLHRADVIHRNLKSENLLVTAEGRVLLCEFGFARLLDDRDLPHRVGSHCTLPPEYLQFIDQDQPDVRELTTTALDIYTLGFMLYEIFSPCYQWQEKKAAFFIKGSTREEILASRKQFQGLSEPTVLESPIGRLIANMVDPDPKKRPTIDEIAEQFKLITEENGKSDAYSS